MTPWDNGPNILMQSITMMAPRLDIFHLFSQLPPHATYESFLVGGRLDADSLFVICSVCMYFRMKAKPQGLTYTYCWLGCCGLSLLATTDGKSLAACMGNTVCRLSYC